MGKKHLSVLMLYVRSSIIPLLGMLVLIGSIQTGLFLWRMNRGANSLEAVIQSAHLRAVLMSGFLLLAAFLYRIVEDTRCDVCEFLNVQYSYGKACPIFCALLCYG